MLGFREQASFLISHGHADPWDYTPGFLFDECWIANKRINQVMASDMQSMQITIGSLLDKKIGKSYDKLVKRLVDS